MANLENFEKGLGQRYKIQRLDGKEAKHIDCDYFVLDLTHDPLAVRAAAFYAEAADLAGHIQLAQDLREKVEAHELRINAQRLEDDLNDRTRESLSDLKNHPPTETSNE